MYLKGEILRSAQNDNQSQEIHDGYQRIIPQDEFTKILLRHPVGELL
jgi:hypothetical protein